MLGEDGDEPLETSAYRSVYHYRASASRSYLPPIAFLAGLLIRCSRIALFAVRLSFFLGFGLRIGHFRRHVLQVELLRELKVKLDGGTLEISLESVGYCNVNLWPVEGTVAGIKLPFHAALGRKVVQGAAQPLFRQVPSFDLSEEFFWSRGKFHLEREAKVAVHGL